METPTDIIEILYCYAHEDETLRRELDIQLAALKRRGLINTWHDRDISAGVDWKHVVDRHLNEAQIILLLVSADFIASEYHYGFEMQRALERYRRKEACVILVLLRPTDLQGIFPHDLQILPRGKDGKPEAVTQWIDKDAAFLNITESIKKVVKELSPPEKTDPFQLAKEQGDIHLKAKRYLEARIAYERALDLDPNDLTILKSTGVTLLGLKSYNEALNAFERAIQLDPINADLYKSKGDTLYKLKRNEIALDAYEEALKRNPCDANLQVKRGTILEHLGRNEEALIAYEQAIYLDSNNATPYLRKARLLRTLSLEKEDQFEKDREVLAAYEQAIGLNPHNSKISFELGNFLYEIGYDAEALVVYKQAIDFDPQDADLYITESQNLAHNQEKVALNILEYLLGYHPKNVNIYIEIGDILCQMHREPEAVEFYKQAIDFDSQNVDLYIQISKTLHNHMLKMDILDYLLAYNAKNARIYLEKGDVLYMINTKPAWLVEKSLYMYKKALRLYPRNSFDDFDIALKKRLVLLYKSLVPAYFARTGGLLFLMVSFLVFINDTDSVDSVEIISSLFAAAGIITIIVSFFIEL